MKDLSSDPEDHSANKHDSKCVFQPSEPEDDVAQDAEHGWDDKDYSGPDAVDENASQEGDNNIRESIEWV